MIPSYRGAPYDARGVGEIFPLNNVTWSLFYEYIGNILYALVLRKMSTKMLKLIVVALGITLLIVVTTMSSAGNINAGWELKFNHIMGGGLRLMFSYSLGLLISRDFRPIRSKIKNKAFWLATFIIIITFFVPHLGKTWVNGLYEGLLIVAVFPMLLWLGASEQQIDKKSAKAYTYLGELSYPIYMTHFPIVQLFYSYIRGYGLSIRETWHIALLVFILCLVVGHIVLTLYDIPMRNLLKQATHLGIRKIVRTEPERIARID